MRLISLNTLLAIALSVPLAAAEPAATPWADLTIPDGARLLAHWATGPIGRAWADAGVTPLRTRIDREVPNLIGLDPFAVLAKSTDLRAMLTSIDGPADDPHLHYQVQAKVVLAAEQVFAAIAKHGTPVDVADVKKMAGVDEAVLLGEDDNQVRLIRRGPWLLLGPAADASPQPVLAAGEHDVMGTVAGPRFAEWVLANHPTTTSSSSGGPSDAQIRSLMPALAGHLDLTAAGGQSQVTIATAAPWLAPIDQKAFKRLPAQLLDVTAFGLDGTALWREAEPWIKDLIAPGKPGADALADLGISATWEHVLTGLGGTWTIAISPGMPMPGYSVIGPRSPALDELLAVLAHKYDSELPAEGASVTLMPQGSPLSVTLARTADQWLATSDPMFAATWIDATDGGWLASPLGKVATAKLAGDGCLVLIGDTQAQIRSLAPLVGVGLSSMPGVILQPAERQAAMTFFNRLATKVTPGWSVVRHQGATLVATGEGVLSTGGSVPVVAVLAGMMLPAINLVREGARKANSGNNIRQLVLGSCVWCNDNDQQWPPDLEKMRSDMGGDIPDKIMHSPGDPTRTNPYLYIRPASNGSSIQPAIVEDPACWKGKGCNVGFCDGHIAWIPRARAKRVWTEAQRLAALPKAAIKDQGIAPKDWSAVQEDLTPGAKLPQEPAP